MTLHLSAKEKALIEAVEDKGPLVTVTTTARLGRAWALAENGETCPLRTVNRLIRIGALEPVGETLHVTKDARDWINAQKQAVSFHVDPMALAKRQSEIFLRCQKATGRDDAAFALIMRAGNDKTTAFRVRQHTKSRTALARGVEISEKDVPHFAHAELLAAQLIEFLIGQGVDFSGITFEPNGLIKNLSLKDGKSIKLAVPAKAPQKLDPLEIYTQCREATGLNSRRWARLMRLTSHSSSFIDASKVVAKEKGRQGLRSGDLVAAQLLLLCHQLGYDLEGFDFDEMGALIA